MKRPLGLWILPRRIHYGWWISIAGAAVMFATVGVGFYGLAVFLQPLQDENGWSNAWVSGATGLYFSASGVTGFLVGPYIDRHGPVRFMTGGVALVEVSGILLAFVGELWQLYAVYLLQAIAFGLSGSVAVNSILIAFLLVLLAQTGFLLHQIAFLTGRLGSANAAAFALSTTAFGSIVARFALGQFADRLDKRATAAGLFVLQGGAVLGLLAIDSTIVTYGLVLVIGFTIGNIYMVQSLIVAEIFGLVSMSTVFGVVSLAAQVGSGLGPFAMGALEDATGNYQLAFTSGAAVTLASAVVIMFARPPATVRSPDGPRAVG